MENKENVQKFLIEEAKLVRALKCLYDNKEYDKVVSKKDEVFKNIDFYKKTNALDLILKSMFEKNYFEEIVTFTEELRKKDVEDMNISFYMLASLISLDDIDMAKSYLKRSKLMNSDYVQSIILEDGANYTNILNANEGIPCLLLINYIKEFDQEGIDIQYKDINNKANIRIFKFFDMLDNMCQFGYDEKMINYMTDVGAHLFAREMFM